jgi:hypothetical protein
MTYLQINRQAVYGRKQVRRSAPRHASLGLVAGLPTNGAIALDLNLLHQFQFTSS